MATIFGFLFLPSFLFRLLKMNRDSCSLGPLLQDLDRDVRLVVDTGIHAMHWTIEQAAEFIINNTDLSSETPMVHFTSSI